MKIETKSTEEQIQSSKKNCLVLVNALLGLGFLHYFVYLIAQLANWIF
jgi:hypothetical protein